MQRVAALAKREPHHSAKPDEAARPVSARRTLTGAGHGHAGGDERQQPGDDSTVRARHQAHGVGGEQWEADDDADNDDGEAAQLPWGREGAAPGSQGDGGEYCGHRPPAGGGQHRVEATDGDLRHRQREAEAEYTDGSQDHGVGRGGGRGPRDRRHRHRG